MPMGRPIRPRPINPIFLGPVVGFKRGLLVNGGREARLYVTQNEDTIVAELRGGVLVHMISDTFLVNIKFLKGAVFTSSGSVPGARGPDHPGKSHRTGARGKR